jgi:hypothetical protein
MPPLIQAKKSLGGSRRAVAAIVAPAFRAEAAAFENAADSSTSPGAYFERMP